MKKYFYTLLLLTGSVLLVLVLLTPFDYTISKYIIGHRQENNLTHFFNFNIYEHNIFGIADIVVLFLLGSLTVYALSFIPFFSSLKKFRKASGYVISAGVTVALSIVHAWKWAFSRVRPYDVFDKTFDLYTHWFMPGRYTLEVGFNQGSFPSGHVATVAILMTLFFLMPKQKYRYLRWLYAFVVFLLSAYMVWLRTMVRQHWFNDNVASYGIALVILYFFYWFIHYPPSKKLSDLTDVRVKGWEFYFTLLNLFFLFAVAAIFVGLRMFFMEHNTSGIAIFASGVFFSLFLFDVIWKLLFQKTVFINAIVGFKNKAQR